MLTAGLVGLPNVGKSSLFNLLTSAGAEVSNYPFTTIDRQLGVVTVPDRRLEKLATMLGSEDVTFATIQFTDIAGLVEGASRGEGLGNQFLAHIRDVDAIVHVIRCFEDDSVAHVFGSVDPVRDAHVVETELQLSDLERVERIGEKREREWKADPKAGADGRRHLEDLHEALAAGHSVSSASLSDEARSWARELGLLTAQPVLFVANVDESPPNLGRLEESLTAGNEAKTRVIPIAVRWEQELAELPPGERESFRSELGLVETGIGDLIETTFELLGLVRFYTLVHDKLRAWEVPVGTTAVSAAGRIHTDMETGFIRARVFQVDELEEHQSLEALHHAGRIRTEGRDYVIQDGDVVEILFQSS